MRIILTLDEVKAALVAYAATQGLTITGAQVADISNDGSVELSVEALVTKVLEHAAPHTTEAAPTSGPVKGLNVVKDSIPAVDLSVWNRESWVNLRSSGFRKYVEANLDTLANCDAETMKAVTAKWGTLYKDETFPNVDFVDAEPTPEPEPEPTPDTAGEKEPVVESTVGGLMDGEQKTDDTSLPEEATEAKSDEESLFG